MFDGTRVAKSDPRVATYGDVDELNAWLGFVRSGLSDSQLGGMLERIQRDLFALGARLADPASRIAARVAKAAVTPDDVARLEQWIDDLETELPPLRRFILSGGSASGAALHVARTVCRRAERAHGGARPGRVRGGPPDVREPAVGPAFRDGARGQPAGRRGGSRVVAARVSAPDTSPEPTRLPRLARSHYENFPVASLLLPAAMRPHIAAIYAFARRADDFADEPGPDDAERLARLEDWRRRLHAERSDGPRPGRFDLRRARATR